MVKATIISSFSRPAFGFLSLHLQEDTLQPCPNCLSGIRSTNSLSQDRSGLGTQGLPRLWGPAVIALGSLQWVKQKRESDWWWLLRNRLSHIMIWNQAILSQCWFWSSLSRGWKGFHPRPQWSSSPRLTLHVGRVLAWLGLLPKLVQVRTRACTPKPSFYTLTLVSKSLLQMPAQGAWSIGNPPLQHVICHTLTGARWYADCFSFRPRHPDSELTELAQAVSQ